jgi:hypothetical protein
MSTNFYVTVAADNKEIHFGKSSIGWVFKIRQYPEQGLFTLYDWMSLLASPYNTVRDEYGSNVSVVELMNTVMNRTGYRRGTGIAGNTPGEGSWDYNNYDFC